MSHGRARHAPLAITVACAVLGGSTQTAWAHGAQAHDQGRRAAERELVERETRTIGPAHAAEHAGSRAAQRRSAARLRRMSPAERRAQNVRERARSRSVARAAATIDPAVGGRWEAAPPFRIPIVGIHAAMLPTGKVMWFSHPGDRSENRAEAWLWDPAKGKGPDAFEQVDPPIDPLTQKPANIWCAGQSFLADGRLLVTGGNLDYPSGSAYYKGARSVFTFDPFAEEWRIEQRMQRGRWYPTQTLMGDGRTLVVSGTNEDGNGRNHDIDVYTPPSDPREGGTVKTIGRYRYTSGDPAHPATGTLYPHVFLMPDGNLLHAGGAPEDSWLLSGAATGPDITPGRDWWERPDYSRHREYSSAVLLPDGPAGSTRVMQIGGFDKPGGTESVASTEIYDESTPMLAPKAGPALNTARSHQNTVQLPGGAMVTVGGGYGDRPSTDGQWAGGPEHKTVEIYDAKDRVWKTGPAQRLKRAYHSTALLLPDGRVLSAGDDGGPAAYEDSAEIYEPPYLHTPGPRPVIDAAPAAVSWDQRFLVPTRSTGVLRASLMAPGATTHAVDMSQREVPLQVRRRNDGRGLELTAPPTSNVAPPGWYMLFLIGDDGKPSIASWVRLGADVVSIPLPPDSAPKEGPQPVAPGSGTTIVPAPTATPVPRPAAPGQAEPDAPGPTPRAVTPTVRLRVLGGLAGVRRTGRVRLRVGMDAAGTVVLTARLGRFALNGSPRLRVDGRAARTVTLKLGPRGRQQVARARSLRLTVVLRGRTGSGGTVAHTLRATVR